MSIGTTTRPEVEEPRSVLATMAAKPHVRQTTAEITARVCGALPFAAVTAAAGGLVTGAIMLARRRRGRG
jgi:hypothetical protein